MFARRNRHSLKIAVLTLSGLLLLFTPGLGQASYGGGVHAQETVEGQMLMLHSDDFKRERDKDWNALRTNHGELVKVDLSQVRDADTPLPGERVRLTGERHNGVFLAVDAAATSGASTTQATQTATLSATTATTHKTAVILLNFTNDPSQPWTPSAVSDVMFGEANSVNAYYKESSYGSVSFTGSVFGWVTIPYDNSGCEYWNWGNAAQQALGIDTTQYDNIVYIWPQAADCDWGGMGTLGGSQSWINGWLAVRPLAHELGHNLGVHHAGSLTCTENAVRVAISAPQNCSRMEYGDPFSVMGGTTRAWSNWNRAQVGWIPELITITRTGTYTVAPEEFGVQPRLVRVARGDGTYFYFEFRQPSGTFDNFSSTDPAVNGVLIRLAPDKTVISQSALIDTTPGTSSRDDAALAAGQTFTDPVSGMSVTTTGVTPQGATISVSLGGTPGATSGDTTAPKAPSNLKALVIGTTQLALSWVPSTDDVGVVVYDVYRDGSKVDETPVPNWLDESLVAGSTHKYQVLARDAAGNSSLLSSALSSRQLALSTATTGALAGVVYTVLGRPQANAVVQLTGNGIVKSAKTGSSGTYKFSALPPGTYSLTVTRPATAAAASSSATLAATVAPGVTFVLVSSP